MADDDKVLIRAETPSEKKTRKRLKWGRIFRVGGAAVVVLVVLILALTRTWPFNHAPPKADRTNPTVWQLLLDDRGTLGMVRLALAAGALFAVLSVLGLVAQNRWLRNFLGLKVDDPGTVSELKAQLDSVQDERDEARAERDEALDQRDAALDRLATLEAERGSEPG